MNNKALIAMSGGVDSSVAAYLMKQQGFECIGCTMKLYSNEDAGISREHTCCSLDDIADARSVAAALDIPYYVFNFSDDFREKIIQKFIDSYERAVTPNPCIDCNRYMKFGKLYERARVLGCDTVVTGHYVRIDRDEEGLYRLKKALDPTKDQSYVLYTMTQDQLRHTQFPLGTLKKTEARDLAEANGLVNARKPDSQDICFVPDGDYAKVIRQHTGRTYAPGNFVTKDGKILGKHKGIIHYTLGQRKGLGIAAPEPLYVVRIDTKRNEVVLGSNEDLFSREAHVTDVNWISGKTPDGPIHCTAKARYRMEDKPAVVTPLPDGSVQLVFDEPQRAITPGQAAVFYDGDIVLGGGVIGLFPM